MKCGTSMLTDSLAELVSLLTIANRARCEVAFANLAMLIVEECEDAAGLPMR